MKNFLLPLALVAASAVSAHSQLINVQFGGNSGGGSLAAVQTGTGLIGSPGDQWNDFTDNANLLAGVGLINSLGTVTTATLTVSSGAGGIYQYGDGVGSSSDTLSDGTPPSSVANLASGELGNGSSLTLNLTNLAADTTYQIYLLSAPDRWERSSSWSVNGGTALTVGPLNSYTGGVDGVDRPYNPYGGSAPYNPVEGVNYLLLTGTTDGSGDLSIVGDSVSGDVDINGFQLQAETTSAVPEPSTSALLIGGFLSLVFMLRKRARMA